MCIRDRDSLGSGQEEVGALTPNEAEREIQKIMGDQKSPYWDKNHPEHKSVVDEVFKLRNMKLGVSTG